MSRYGELSRSALIAVALSATSNAAHADDLNADLPNSWERYALFQITPNFSWAEQAKLKTVRPSVLSQFLDHSFETNHNLFEIKAFGASRVHFSLTHQLAPDTPTFTASLLSQTKTGASGSGIDRTFLAPSITQSLGESGSALTGTIILAYQQFSSWGLNADGFGITSAANQHELEQKSYGTGVRLRLDQPINTTWALDASFQSRINMDKFQNYRGVYGGAGDFDLPAIAKLGLQWSLSSQSSLHFQSSRVRYSEISPFTSRALPVRFLSLLGDGPSPVFAWRDLTVHSIDWRYQATPNDTLTLYVGTRQQAEPEQAALRAALAEQYTHKNFALAYDHALSANSKLQLRGSYAASQSFLGNSPFISSRDYSGAQVEFEAVWTASFD